MQVCESVQRTEGPTSKRKRIVHDGWNCFVMCSGQVNSDTVMGCSDTVTGSLPAWCIPAWSANAPRYKSRQYIGPHPFGLRRGWRNHAARRVPSSDFKRSAMAALSQQLPLRLMLPRIPYWVSRARYVSEAYWLPRSEW